MKPYQLGLYEKSMPGSLSIEEKLQETGNASFDYLELSIDETDEKLARLEWGKDEISAINRAAEESGIPVKSICLSGHRKFPMGDPDAETRGKSLSIMERALTLAARLGVRIIQIAGYDVYYKKSTEETKKFFAENLEKSVHLAAREGVILAFETMETPFIDTVEKAMNWVKKFPSPYLQVYPDTGNITNAALLYGTTVPGDIEKASGHLAALHLKESKPGIYREVPYGEGHVNFGEAIAAAWREGCRRYVAEFWHSAPKSGEADRWRTILHDNSIYLRDILDKAVVDTAEKYR
ncbi:putative hexulose-6-phosphate isomerase [Leadbettera azotonutricia ZAS-9]|uniref:Putative hexulose-6-phosphate isomerase n=2 Tax=Leadbettera azotonutricia TaxID=150829 RepID=F5Y886_LEAAZ|nr:putative hexulose-6-phosphate isomerase [Leadbettera azotonutricia ZAS-9]